MKLFHQSVNMNSTTIFNVKNIVKNIANITYLFDNFFSEESTTVFGTCTYFDKCFNNDHLQNFNGQVSVCVKTCKNQESNKFNFNPEHHCL